MDLAGFHLSKLSDPCISLSGIPVFINNSPNNKILLLASSSAQFSHSYSSYSLILFVCLFVLIQYWDSAQGFVHVKQELCQ